MPNELSNHLKDEYLLLQNSYEEFDNRALTIKSWSAALLAGGVAFGVKENSIAVLIITIVASLTLWILETIWKSFQYCFSRRIEEIEKWFREGQKGEIAPFQIYTSWLKAWREQYRPWFQDNQGTWRINHKISLKHYWQIFKNGFVFLPYLPIIALSVISIVWLMFRSN